MSHNPAHVFGAATTEIVTNAAGERQAVLVCYCMAAGCGERQELSGGVFEPPEGFHHALEELPEHCRQTADDREPGTYRHVQRVAPVHEEPDD